MIRRQQWISNAALCLAVLAMTACADRGQTYSQEGPGVGTSEPMSRSTEQAGRTAVKATGCFQEMSGMNNFVLSNVGDAPGVKPGETRAYRIEQRGEFEQHIGKKVSINGWVESPNQAGGAPASASGSGDLDFNDMPELHVDSITPLGESCGTSAR